MDKLDKMLKSVLAGFTTFYGISGSANTLSAGEPESDEINSDFLNVTRIDNKIKTPEYVLELPDRTESGLFASHRSHRSHSSHRSHYSSRTGTTTPAPVKKYTPVPASPVLTDTTLGVRVLKKGMSGPDVFELETLLKRKGYKLVKPDRYFDETVEIVVKDFQSKAGIPADGTVGPLTILYLKQ